MRTSLKCIDYQKDLKNNLESIIALGSLCLFHPNAIYFTEISAEENELDNNISVIDFYKDSIYANAKRFKNIKCLITELDEANYAFILESFEILSNDFRILFLCISTDRKSLFIFYDFSDNDITDLYTISPNGSIECVQKEVSN